MMKCCVKVIKWQSDIAYFWDDPIWEQDFWATSPPSVKREATSQVQSHLFEMPDDVAKEVEALSKRPNWRKESDKLFSKSHKSTDYVIQLHILDYGTLDGLP